jgi:hypothetical protein
LIACQFFAQAVIPDVPEEVQIQIQRNEFIHEKVIEKVEDEDYDEVEHDDHSGDEDEEDDKKKKKGFLALNFKKKKGGKVKTLSEDYPMGKYPHGATNPLSWPKVIKFDPNGKTASQRELNPDDITPDVSVGNLTPKEPTADYY